MSKGIKDIHLLNAYDREIDVAVQLLAAQRQFFQASRDAKRLRREMVGQAVDELARRRWLDALGRREDALEAIEQLEEVIGLSDAITSEMSVKP